MTEEVVCDYFGGRADDKFPPRLLISRIPGGFRLSLRGQPKRWDDGYSEPADAVEVDVPAAVAQMIATQLGAALPVKAEPKKGAKKK